MPLNMHSKEPTSFYSLNLSFVQAQVSESTRTQELSGGIIGLLARQTLCSKSGSELPLDG